MRIVVIYYNIGIASGHGHSTETLIFTLKDVVPSIVLEFPEIDVGDMHHVQEFHSTFVAYFDQKHSYFDQANTA